MSEFSRRIGSKAAATTGEPGPIRTGAWTLMVVPAFIILPLVSGIIMSNPERTLGSVVAMVLLFGGGVVMRRGLRAEVEYARRLIAKAPPPLKTIATAMVTAGVFVLSWLGNQDSIWMAVIFAALAGFGSYLAYGLDPRGEKGIDSDTARRSGVKTKDVIAAIEEANGKIKEIEDHAAIINSRELKERLARITRQARAVLRQIEMDPGDLRRSRRFLVTYLDGTRDVVTKYTSRQKDLATTPLAENFRHVLETVEQVFTEQVETLKRNESLDLEVQIDVLKTQLEREGVG